MLATVGVSRLLFFSGTRQVAAWELVVPVLALALLGYTLYKNVVPFPSGLNAVAPLLALLWLVAGVVFVLAARRRGRAGRERD